VGVCWPETSWAVQSTRKQKIVCVDIRKIVSR
jgi:hypothetical protein